MLKRERVNTKCPLFMEAGERTMLYRANGSGAGCCFHCLDANSSNVRAEAVKRCSGCNSCGTARTRTGMLLLCGSQAVVLRNAVRGLLPTGIAMLVGGRCSSTS